MKARYYPWAIAGGLCATLAPGTPLWVVPLLGAAAHMAYDADPQTWQESGQRLLTATREIKLLERARPLLTSKATRPQADADEDERDDAPAAIAHPNKAPLFTALEERPHQLLIGHTGGGKTTVLHELATGWAASGQRVMVCDPDAAPGQWPGCRVVGGGDDYEAIAKVLDLTMAEVKRRRQLRKEGQRHFAPIRLVVDESADVIGELGDEAFWSVAEPILRRGRKLNVHLTMGVQDNQVGTLGLEGKSHLMHNMSVADLYLEPDGRRIARFGRGKAARVVEVPALKSPEDFIIERPQPRPVVAARVAPQPAVAALGETERLPRPAVAPDALLAGLLAQEPPRSEPTATATIERDGTTINVYAQASAPAATGRSYTRKATGPNVRQRAERLKVQRPQPPEDLSAVYARLAHLKFDDAWEAAGKKPSNRNQAHKLWKAARGR